MTQPQQGQTLELPKANYPLVNRVIADHPFPTETKPGEPVDPNRPPVLLWTLAQQHPLVANLKIVRMYVVPGVSVEIYSASEDGKIGVRNAVPWRQVRLIEEVCDAETFVEEIRAAEEDDDDPEPEPVVPTVNGLQPMPNGGVS